MDIEIFSLIYSADVQNSQGWAGWKKGTQNSVQISHLVGWGPNYCRQYLLSPRVIMNRELE